MNTDKIAKFPLYSSVALHQRLERVYDHLYANSPVKTPAAIGEEVGKILHVGLYIEENTPRLFPNNDAAQAPAFSFTAVAKKKLVQGDKLACAEIAGKVRKDFSKMQREWKLYDSDSTILLTDSDIAFVCAELDNVLISDRNRDVIGDAIEIFRSTWAKREGGQFFTDAQVTRLAMTLLDFNPAKGDDLVDICCGSGGFLLAGLNHIRELVERDSKKRFDEQKFVRLVAQSVRGQEVDGHVCEMANSTLQARLGKLKDYLVVQGDSIKPESFYKGTSNGIKYDNHLCVATNPPFGTKITIKDESILRQYELANSDGRQKASSKLSHRAPDTLFIEQNIRLLKPGFGRLAIVVPYQVLSGPQARFIREWILQQSIILAVIDLPADTFQPHTGTKACLLVLKRRKSPITDLGKIPDNKVFFSIPRWIGHDRRGNPVYKRLSDGSLSGEILTDIPNVEKAFKQHFRGVDPSKSHSESFVMPLSKILGDPLLRLNASYCRPGNAPISQSSLGKKWEFFKLKDVVEKIFYPTRFKRNYVDFYPGAIPFFGGANISQLITTTEKWLRHDDPYLDMLRVKAGWLLITRSGSTGIISTVPDAWDGAAMSEHVIRIVPNPKKLNPNYIHSFLRTQHAQSILKRGIFGSVIDEITPEYIGEMEIPVPKSKSMLKRIIDKTDEAQKARNIAIDYLLESVECLNVELSSDSQAQQCDVA